MINRAGARYRNGVQKRVNVILENRPKRVIIKNQRCELTFFWFFFFKQKMICTVINPFLAPSILGRKTAGKASDSQSVIRTLSSILVYMRGHGLTVGDVRRNVFLIRAYGFDDSKRTRVDLLTTVADDADHNFLPTVFISRPAAIPLAQISTVLHDATHRPRNRPPSSLYMVMTMNRSVRRGGS